jgi:phage shock protein A
VADGSDGVSDSEQRGLAPAKEAGMTQQSILGRISQLTKANINALLDAAEDPEKMLDQMIRDYMNNIDDANDAVATTIGSLRMMEEDEREARETATEWGAKAAAAARKADELRAQGDAADADKFENLARVALKKQIDYEEQARGLQPTIAQQTEVVTKLKAGMQTMNAKLDELKTRRNELVSRAKMARAQAEVHDALSSVDVMDPTSEISRFEDKIRREEARVAGQAELAASSLDSQFEGLEDEAEDAEVEARLAALRSGTKPGS